MIFERIRAMKCHVSLLVTGISASKNVARPWYDDFWGRKGQSGPSPRLVRSKWRRTQARWLDHLTVTISPPFVEVVAASLFSARKRVSNAPLKVWKITWHRRRTVAAFEKLVAWKRSLENIIGRAAFATDVTRARDRTRDSPESTYDALQLRVDGPVLIRLG